MKANFKITFCAMLSALATAFMLLSYFPYLTYAIPAISGVLIMITVIETGTRWALLSYISSAILVFLFAEPESKLMYICFFGFYPIAKAIIEKINKAFIEWVFKLLVFNISIILIYFVFASLFNVSVEEFGQWGRLGAMLFLAFGNVIFVVYDFAISRIACTYLTFLHPKIKKMFRIK